MHSTQTLVEIYNSQGNQGWGLIDLGYQETVLFYDFYNESALIANKNEFEECCSKVEATASQLLS